MRIGIDARKIADFGIGTYIRGLLGGLASLETGDEIVAFAPEGTEIPRGIEHVALDAPHYSLRELIAVGRAAERAGVDLIHAPHYVVPVTRLPVVVTIHDLIHLHQPWRNPFKPLYARVMLRRAVRRAAAVLTVSEAVRAEIERELGSRRVFVTPNGVEPPSPSASSAASRAPYFLFVGNDKPHKNVETLIEAFSRVRRDHRDVNLVLAGGTFTRFSTLDGVEAAGFVSSERLGNLYRHALALVMPSIEEGFGLPAAEAMAAGTAVITSSTPALIEVTGDAALHVAARDANALAAAMKKIVDDEVLRQTLGRRGLERAKAMTWTRCATLTRTAYAAAIASSRF